MLFVCTRSRQRGVTLWKQQSRRFELAFELIMWHCVRAALLYGLAKMTETAQLEMR